MARKSEDRMLDGADWRLMGALQADGRAPLKALGRAAGLSIAATAERLRRLRERGVVRGIGATVDATLAGYTVKAIVGITVEQPGKRAFLERLRRAPEVLECHHVAGDDSYVMIVIAAGLAELERFLGAVNVYGETRTSIVFSTPIERRGLLRPGVPRRDAERGAA